MVQTPSLLSRVAPFFFSDVVLKGALGRRCTLLVIGPIVGYLNGSARYVYIAITAPPHSSPTPLTPSVPHLPSVPHVPSVAPTVLLRHGERPEGPQRGLAGERRKRKVGRHRGIERRSREEGPRRGI
jgi:hypothetical protein